MSCDYRISDVNTTLLTGPSTNDPYLREARVVRSAAFVEIRLANGIVGVGETYAGYFCPEVVPFIVDFFRPVLVGQLVDDVPELWQRMYHCGNFWCRAGLGLAVINGIEAALWDLRGKLEGKPVCDLPGGATDDTLPCYATGGPANYPLDRLAAKVEHYLSLGFRGAKLSVGAQTLDGGFFCPVAPQEAADLEAEKLQFIRRRFGTDLEVMLDGHMSNSPSATWGLETAQAVAAALEPFELSFFEEPLHYNDIEGYSELCRTSSVPIAGGETLIGLGEWRQFVERDCFDIGQPDASFTGGIGTFVEVARLFESRGRRIATHSWGAGGSLMQNIHGGFAANNTIVLEIPPDYGPLHTEIVGDSFRMENGLVLRPRAPGLGVTLTEETKQRFPFVPGSGEFNSVPGKVLHEEKAFR